MNSRSMPSAGKAPDLASASLPDTLAALHVNPETGLTQADVDVRRKEYGYTTKWRSRKATRYASSSESSGAYRRGCWS